MGVIKHTLQYCCQRLTTQNCVRLIVFIKSSLEKESLSSRDLPSNLNLLILTNVPFKENSVYYTTL